MFKNKKGKEKDNKSEFSLFFPFLTQHEGNEGAKIKGKKKKKKKSYLSVSFFRTKQMSRVSIFLFFAPKFPYRCLKRRKKQVDFNIYIFLFLFYSPISVTDDVEHFFLYHILP